MRHGTHGKLHPQAELVHWGARWREEVSAACTWDLKHTEEVKTS